MKIILASASPRRRELLANAGVEFDVVISEAEENLPCGASPDEACVALARVKAKDVAKKFPSRCVLGADTVVVLDGEILGKPSDEADAERMLKKLSGREHGVFTGVCVIKNGQEHTFYEKTSVSFYELTEEEIRKYIGTGEPMDKAGAYGIQGKGCVLVRKIDGDYFNVVGLPVAKTVRLLNRLAGFGVDDVLENGDMS